MEEADSLMSAEAGGIRQVAAVVESREAGEPTGNLAVEEVLVGPRSGPRPEAASAPRSANRFHTGNRTGSRAHSWSRSWDT